jgi:hypothetical protein
VTGVRDSRYPDPIHFAYKTGLFTATLLARWTQDINRSAWYRVSQQWWSSLKYPLIRRLVGNVTDNLEKLNAPSFTHCSWTILKTEASYNEMSVLSYHSARTSSVVTILHGLVLQET